MISASDALKMSEQNGRVAAEKYISENIEPMIKCNAGRGMRTASVNKLPPTEVRELVIQVLKDAGYRAELSYARNQMDNSSVDISW